MRNFFFNRRPTKSARRYSPPPDHLPPLFYHITNRDWAATILRCQTHVHEATFMDRWGNTALHLACRFGGHQVVPLNVIQILLEISSPNTQNVDGCTPLHLACSHRSSADIISALLDASRRELSCSYRALQKSLTWSNGNNCEFEYSQGGSSFEFKNEKRRSQIIPLRSGAAILTKSGKTPLHYACGSYRHLSIEAFRILLEATYKDSDSSDFILYKDDNGETPLSLLQKRFSERIRQAIDIVKSSNARNGSEMEPNDSTNPTEIASMIEDTLGEFWEKASMILQISYHGITHFSSSKHNDEEQNNEMERNNLKRHLRWRIVHASIGVGSKCPKPVVMLALTTYPEQVQECDEHGNFPLHIAAMCQDVQSHLFEEERRNASEVESSAESRDDQRRHLNEDDHQRQIHLEDYCADFNLLETLIKIFPKAAQTPNADGHLPFALAIDCGKWTWGKALMTLLKAFPSALECLDLKDEYFPFILYLIKSSNNDYSTSIGNGEGYTKRSKVNHEDYVNLFYELLRERPFIVKCAQGR